MYNKIIYKDIKLLLNSAKKSIIIFFIHLLYIANNVKIAIIIYITNELMYCMKNIQSMYDVNSKI